MTYNPYSPPARPQGAPAGQGAPGLPTDSTDLYIETLPSTIVRGAGICAAVTAIIMLFSLMRFLIGGAEGTFLVSIEGVLVLCALAEFGIAWGVTGGRVGWVIVGFGFTPLVLIVSALVLVTGSLVGMFGMSLAIVNVVLLALGYTKVRRMGQARAAMRAMAA